MEVLYFDYPLEQGLRHFQRKKAISAEGRILIIH